MADETSTSKSSTNNNNSVSNTTTITVINTTRFTGDFTIDGINIIHIFPGENKNITSEIQTVADFQFKIKLGHYIVRK